MELYNTPRMCLEAYGRDGIAHAYEPRQRRRFHCREHLDPRRDAEGDLAHLLVVYVTDVVLSIVRVNIVFSQFGSVSGSGNNNRLQVVVPSVLVIVVTLRG